MSMETEAYDELIKALTTYQTELETSKRKMVEAGVACDAAMGSDEVAKKQLERLNEMITTLGKTIIKTENLKKALMSDKMKALDVLK